jgi:hypothetical protein
MKDVCLIAFGIVMAYQHILNKEVSEKIEILEHKLKHFIIEKWENE